MARSIDQVQDVGLTVVGEVRQPDRVRLDGDPALPLEIHAVEDLGLHLAHLQRPGDLEEPIRKRRLAVVDMGDDREVADEALVHLGVRSPDYSLMASHQGSGLMAHGSGRAFDAASCLQPCP
jgi:hypothetical protein